MLQQKKSTKMGYFNKGGLSVQKEATYQVLSTLQTCALLGVNQRVKEGNLLHEHTNTNKHPVVFKY
jgi:hypothetical protein